MEYLFSYGTLRHETVQTETYGRRLNGEIGRLCGYRMGEVRISDAEVIRKSGMSMHPVAIPTGNNSDEISGVMFELSPEELQATDSYEVSEYERVKTVLKSGKVCWVYVLRNDLALI